ncbi:MAG: peptidylprolyl isomerase [Calditrichia bacterium]
MAFLLLFTQCAKTYDLPDGLYGVLDTDKGEIIIQLEYQKAPMTVSNFVGLAEGTIKNTFRGPGEPYFDGLTFHRVVPNFVIQGGDPQGNGSGGPGYEFPNEIHPDLKHDAEGVVAMANAGPHTNGSQFYITLNKTPHLDGGYSVFGKVVQGMDVVKQIKQGDKIKKVTILRIGEDAKQFTVTQESFDSLIAETKQKIQQAEENKMAETLKSIKEQWPDIEKSPQGIYYKVLRKGRGAKPSVGQTVVAHYTGKFLDGRVFDSSVSRNQPFEFEVGKGKVIKGWDITLMDMKVGEKRLIVLPPEFGYGKRGAGGVIPPNSFLVFEIELLGIK